MPTTNERSPRHATTVTVVLVATVAWALLTSLVVPVLPLIQRDLRTDQSTTAWVVTGYLLAASVAAPIVGRAGDTFGKKRTLVLVLVLVVFAVGVVIAGLASSVGVLIVARAIQGAGAAILPLGFGILREQLPRDRVGFAISATAAMAGVGTGLGIVLAGPIVSALDYHYLFWLPLIFVVGSAIAAFLRVPESPTPSKERIDVVPALTLTGWLVALLLAISQADHWGWTSGATIALLVAALVLFAAWIRSEVGSTSPLVDLRMMRIPAVWTTNIVALLFGVCLFSAASSGLAAHSPFVWNRPKGKTDRVSTGTDVQPGLNAVLRWPTES